MGNLKRKNNLKSKSQKYRKIKQENLESLRNFESP